MNRSAFRKDESLDRLAEQINVAQFVSFLPGEKPVQAFARVLGFKPNHRFTSLREACERLMERSPESSLNVRSFAPNNPKSHEFIYGLRSVTEVEESVVRIAGSGLHVIVNETVDIHDGGVSGVLQGGVIEFAPDDTPRCVEKPGVASLPASLGLEILRTVYGFELDLRIQHDDRLEFTLHPKPRGWKHGHVLGWELESIGDVSIEPALSWPNHFSRLLGDKAYGLLVASAFGFRVPQTTVISRRIAPFTFGIPTGSNERWIRTCPREQIPGRFTTHLGWIDPFKLMAQEDPKGELISAVLSQYAVRAQHSGALIVDQKGQPIVEGRRGHGEVLMKGDVLPEELPTSVLDDVLNFYQSVRQKLGDVRFEWVHDGELVWLVQLHRGATQTMGNSLVPGEAKEWRKFDVSNGLEKLRSVIGELGKEEGLLLIGRVGVTSHVADIVRKAGRPARLC